MAAGLPFYIFLGLVHSFYLPDQLVSLNKAGCTKIDEAKSVLETCMKPNIDIKEFIVLVEGPKDDPYKFMQKRCSLKPAADNCFDTSLETLKDCFNSTMIQGLEVWKKIDADVSDYVCKNNAEVASDLFQKTEESCWNKGVGEVIHTCGPKLGITAALFDIEGISEHCSKTEEFDECVKDTLTKSCPDNITEIEKTIMQILKTHICNVKKA